VTGKYTIIASDIARELASVLGADRYALWFEQTRLYFEEGVCVVVATNPFILDQVKQSFRQELTQAVAAVLGRKAPVTFRIEKTLSDDSVVESAKSNGASTTDDIETGPAPGSEIIPLPTSVSPKNSQPARRPEAPPMGRRRNTWETFIRSKENEVVRTAAQMSLDRLGAISPLFVYGPTGCGKTHLLDAFANQARQASGVRRVVSLSAEQFTSHFLEALQGSGLPSFRRKYRDLDVLLIDDVQFFDGKRATIVELHHTIDTLFRGGRQLVMAADRSPAELASLGPEFVTRMAAGMVTDMGYPGGEARLTILKRIAAERSITAPNSVFELIANQLLGDVRQLSGALNRLSAESVARGVPITLAFAETALEDLFLANRRVVRLKDVERVVCEVLEIDSTSLQSAQRTRSISHSRMLAMWLARKYTRAAFSEIGEFFGRRSHSTVISAAKKVDGWVAKEQIIDLSRGKCKVNDALRRVEAALRSGS